MERLSFVSHVQASKSDICRHQVEDIVSSDSLEIGSSKDVSGELCHSKQVQGLSNVEHAKFKQDSEGGHSLLDEAREAHLIMEVVEVWVSILV